MKQVAIKTAAVLVLAVAAAAPSHAVSFSFGVDDPVPDANDNGVADTRTVSGLSGSITDLSVELQISPRGSGGWNGDLYATLVHESGFVVLLNRPGKTSDNPIGFGDSGLTVTFNAAALGDIHLYRNPDDAPLTQPLTGSWLPDGRATDPAEVLGTDPRTEFLSSFNGVDPNGSWTLFVADLEFGGTSQFVSWGLNITSTAVPDSNLRGMGVGLLLGTVLLGRRFRSN